MSDETIPYRVFAIFARPNESIDIAAAGGRIELTATAGTATRISASAFRWTAPRVPGLYPLTVRLHPEASIRLNAFVLLPASRAAGGRLNGYRIGSYPAHPLRGLPIYRPPAGFVEVTPDNRDTPLSPHFTLGQFVCKQAGGFPKYVALRERLVLELELILEHLNAAGIAVSTLHVMSGFRTPYYNAAIGNVPFSRHQWGGAADIFVDANPRDGVMDDLDGDGRVDLGDARFLYDFIERLEATPEFAPFVGGLGLYGPTSHHGPFVHVDARGFRARWLGSGAEAVARREPAKRVPAASAAGP